MFLVFRLSRHIPDYRGIYCSNGDNIAVLGSMLGFILISQIHSSLIIISSVVLFGIGHGLLSPTAMLWIGEIVDSSFQGRIISYVSICVFVGQFLSPIIFGPVSLFVGLSGVFLVAGVISASLFFIFLFKMREMNSHEISSYY